MKLERQYILLLLVLVLGCQSNLPPQSKALDSDSSASNDDTAIMKAIKLSDDFRKHKKAFIAASKQLIDDGRCSLQILEYNGGWIRSQKHKPSRIYFTYLAAEEATIKDRIYLNVSTGKLFR